jgi:hypothetical protein
MTSPLNNEMESDDYGFFCDLESNDEDVEYYVVTKCTHYEVRRKLKTRPKIRGEIPVVIKLSSAKSSIDNLEMLGSAENTVAKGKQKSVLGCIMNFPRDLFYCVCVCLTTGSCVYLIMTQP